MRITATFNVLFNWTEIPSPIQRNKTFLTLSCIACNGNLGMLKMLTVLWPAIFVWQFSKDQYSRLIIYLRVPGYSWGRQKRATVHNFCGFSASQDVSTAGATVLFFFLTRVNCESNRRRQKERSLLWAGRPTGVSHRFQGGSGNRR